MSKNFNIYKSKSKIECDGGNAFNLLAMKVGKLGHRAGNFSCTKGIFYIKTLQNFNITPVCFLFFTFFFKCGI